MPMSATPSVPKPTPEPTYSDTERLDAFERWVQRAGGIGIMPRAKKEGEDPYTAARGGRVGVTIPQAYDPGNSIREPIKSIRGESPRQVLDRLVELDQQVRSGGK